MAESPHTQLPIVDQAILERLREDVNPEVYEGFIRDYLRLLPRRLDRLGQAVQSMDYEAAMDAVLSLKTSSLMVGASRLGALAGDLEAALKTAGTGPDALPWDPAFQARLEIIRDCATATTARLSTETSD